MQLYSNAIIENKCFKGDKFKKHHSLTITQNDMNHYKIVMILSNSRLLATLYYHSFRYSLNNAEEEMENEDDVDWKKCKEAMTSRKGKIRQKE